MDKVIGKVPLGTNKSKYDIPIYLHTAYGNKIVIGKDKHKPKEIGLLKASEYEIINNTIFITSKLMDKFAGYFIVAATIFCINKNNKKYRKICDIHIAKQ